MWYRGAEIPALSVPEGLIKLDVARRLSMLWPIIRVSASEGCSFAGEIGTMFTSSDDKAWMHDFTQWRNNIGAANDGLHNNVNSYFYW